MMVLDVLVSRCLAALVLDHTETECYSVGGQSFSLYGNQESERKAEDEEYSSGNTAVTYFSK